MTGRRLLAWAITIPVVVAGAYGLGSITAPAPTPPPPSPSEPVPPRSVSAPADPVASATAWIEAVHTVSWRDRSPTAWIERSRPFTAEPLAHTIGAATDGTTGTTWTELVDGRCTQRVHDLGGVIPPEAPATPDVVYVQVASTLTQRCEATPPPPPRPLAATVEVRRAPDSTWRVTNQLY